MSSSRSPPFLFIAKKRDGAVQQRGLMSRFFSFLGQFWFVDLLRTYSVGRDKVNCPSGQEKMPWGTTPARRS